MNPILDEFNTVVTGGWNPAVFNPEWVTQNLVVADEAKLEMGFMPGQTFYRISVPGVMIEPRRDRLIVMARGTPRNWTAAAEAAAKALDLLSHTPVRAVGVNFGYMVADPSEELRSVLNLSDRDRVAAAGGEVRTVRVIEQIMLTDRTLNLTLSGAPSGGIQIRANFHQDSAAVKPWAQWIRATVSEGLEQTLLTFLEKAYGLRVEQMETSDAGSANNDNAK